MVDQAADAGHSAVTAMISMVSVVVFPPPRRPAVTKNRELAHLRRRAINIARRRPGSDHATVDLVQHIHLRQPRLIGEWRPDLRPRVLPVGGLAGTRGLGFLRGLLLLRCFERGVDGREVNLGKLLRQLPQLCQIDRVEVGTYGEQCGKSTHLILPPSPSPYARWWRHV